MAQQSPRQGSDQLRNANSKPFTDESEARRGLENSRNIHGAGPAFALLQLANSLELLLKPNSTI